MHVLCLFDLPKVLLDDTLLFHPLSPLLLLAVLVPKSVEEDVLNLATGVVLTDRVQVRLGLVPRHELLVVEGQDFNCGLECPHVFGLAETVVEGPADDWQNNRLDTIDRTKINAIVHKLEQGDMVAQEAVARSESAHTVCATLSTFEEAVQHADTQTKGYNAQDDENVADNAGYNRHVVF